MREKLTEEQRAKRKAELNRARVKRYYEKHVEEQKHVNFYIPPAKKKAFNEKLKEKKMTQKEFFEKAIDKFINEQDIYYF